MDDYKADAEPLVPEVERTIPCLYKKHSIECNFKFDLQPTTYSPLNEMGRGLQRTLLQTCLNLFTPLLWKLPMRWLLIYA